jgi:hypothetical protein
LQFPAALLYPFLGIGGAALSLAAAVSFRQSGDTARRVAAPIYAGALFGVIGLLVTAEAAPNILSLQRLGTDAFGIERAMNGFIFWGNVRGTFQVLAFAANLWSLVAILSTPQTPVPRARPPALWN